MGKFSRNREYTFASLEEIISSVVEEFDDGNNITIALPWNEVSQFIIALISTGKFEPYDIDFGHSAVNDYFMEYYISVNHIGNNYLFVEPAYNATSDNYITCGTECTDILFVSVGVTTTLYNKLIEDGHNTVLFDIED